MTYYNNKNHLNYGNGTMVSLHHTKPIGFGEGGFIVFDNIYLESMQKAICFGYTNTNKYDYDINASNYKMSEIACIYINDYLSNLNDIYNHYTTIIKYFIEQIKLNNLEKHIKLYKNYSSHKNSLMATIPIIFNKKVEIDFFHKNKIEVKKYYYPLNLNCVNSKNIFDNIICFPLNMDVDEKIIDLYIQLLNEFIKNI
jgi:dTDP-4-amino-4,6-dideoxygalactose transaminase